MPTMPTSLLLAVPLAVDDDGALEDGLAAGGRRCCNGDDAAFLMRFTAEDDVAILAFRLAQAATATALEKLEPPPPDDQAGLAAAFVRAATTAVSCRNFCNFRFVV